MSYASNDITILDGPQANNRIVLASVEFSSESFCFFNQAENVRFYSFTIQSFERPLLCARI
jgi:hypothetical protein